MFSRRMLAVAALSLCLATVGRAGDIGYDPRANPFDELASAVARADSESKLVLLISGGDWCIWCHYLYEFLESHADIDAALHDVFIVAKVYVGEDNRNTEFFATLPEAAGAPHFWVLSRRGELLKSQPTVVLEDGAKSYDEAKFRKFVEEWRSRAR
jgi:hypothetical protein